MSAASVSPTRARFHEALTLKLEALAAQLAPLAARQPAAPVSPQLRALAEGLLFDAARLCGRRAPAALPHAMGEAAPLAVQLGQARAALGDFEYRHSQWSPAHQAFAWRIGRGELLPIRRLGPQPPIPPGPDKGAQKLRQDLVRRIVARQEEFYEQGYADAMSGKPPPQ